MPLRRERRSADWLAELDKATLAVEALPFVSAVGFVDVDGKASASKAYAAVTCCWDSSRGTFKRVKVVGLSRKNPTHRGSSCSLTAEHSGDHRHDYRALEKRARENETSSHLSKSSWLSPLLENAARNATVPVALQLAVLQLLRRKRMQRQ